MKTFSLIVGVVCPALLLYGCAPALIGGNSVGGTINYYAPFNRGAAFQKADEHCHQFGRVARISQDDQATTMTFDCVAP